MNSLINDSKDEPQAGIRSIFAKDAKFFLWLGVCVVVFYTFMWAACLFAKRHIIEESRENFSPDVSSTEWNITEASVVFSDARPKVKVSVHKGGKAATYTIDWWAAMKLQKTIEERQDVTD